MMLSRVFLFLPIIFYLSCTSSNVVGVQKENKIPNENLLEFTMDNYKSIGTANAWGIQSVNGEVLLDTIHRSIMRQQNIATKQIAFLYNTKDDRTGLLFNSKVPLIEVDSTYAYIKYINSTEYFGFRLKTPAPYTWGNAGIMDKNKNVIFNDQYNNVSFDGKKLFFLCHKEDKKFYIYNLKGERINDKAYDFIFSGLGISYAGLNLKNKSFDPTKAKYCILDEEGNEITPFEYDYVHIDKCDNKNEKVFLRMEKNGKRACYIKEKNSIRMVKCTEVCDL